MARDRMRTEHPRIRRPVLALVLLAAGTVALAATLVPLAATLYGIPLPLSFLLAAAVCGAPLLAESRPRWAIVSFTAGSFALPLVVPAALATEAPWPWSVPALLSFVLIVGVVTLRHGGRLGVLPLVSGALGSLIAPMLRPEVASSAATAANVTANLIVAASVATAAYLIALLIAGRLRVAAELTREREHSALEESKRVLVEERTRIARELHDVIAHSMSVIQVQASTARYRLSDLDDEAVAEFESIAATARTSLTEMRRMLGVLRTEDQSTELTPQQRIDDVAALVDTLRRAGVTVGLEIAGPIAEASSAVQIAAYRITQEALSNAVRHAHGAAVTVRIRADASSVGIRVRNSPPIEPADSRGSGHGLRGMRERVELLGGTFSAGATDEGGWEVAASLPLAGSTSPPDAASPDPQENP
ncbi:sensor histidine kinase [Microbacterium sp. 179-I 3D3 NHS]|uniref:sensor histidine kinase n=1 Tax=Microbacterium sp. 179-I 3D3 NHS TaxID=3142382 RepID=UPI0039A0A9FE